jgi:hypothetical protein
MISGRPMERLRGRPSPSLLHIRGSVVTLDATPGREIRKTYPRTTNFSAKIPESTDLSSIAVLRPSCERFPRIAEFCWAQIVGVL